MLLITDAFCGQKNLIGGLGLLFSQELPCRCIIISLSVCEDESLCGCVTFCRSCGIVSQRDLGLVTCDIACESIRMTDRMAYLEANFVS